MRSTSTQKLFLSRSSAGYSNMKKRLKRKDLPFTLDKLRSAIREALNGPCPYCNNAFGVKDFSLDHMIPVSREGSIGLSNLRVCCYPCNKLKGNMTDKEYLRFRTFMDTMPEVVRRSVFSRMKAGASMFVRF